MPLNLDPFVVMIIFIVIIIIIFIFFSALTCRQDHSPQVIEVTPTTPQPSSRMPPLPSAPPQAEPYFINGTHPIYFTNQRSQDFHCPYPASTNHYDVEYNRPYPA